MRKNLQNPLIETERVLVYGVHINGRGAAELIVSVPDPALRRTSAYADCAASTLDSYPDLVRHACISDAPRGIRAELADTEVAHLIEHVVIEELVCSGVERGRLSGETSWNFSADGDGFYRVVITGADNAELVASAVIRAVQLVAQFTAV